MLEARNLYADAVRRGKPLLGICLSAQILARALGAPVTRLGDPEIGVVHLSIEGADPILDGLSDIHAFHMHEDSFAAPDGGAILAGSSVCRTQVVRCADRAYAVQFHPEISSDTFITWLRNGYAYLTGNADPAAVEPYIAQAQAEDDAVRADADRLFSNFLKIAAGDQ